MIYGKPEIEHIAISKMPYRRKNYKSHILWTVLPLPLQLRKRTALRVFSKPTEL